MLFKSIQSITSVSKSSNTQVGNNALSTLQGSNQVTLLDNASILSNNSKNQATILGSIFN